MAQKEVSKFMGTRHMDHARRSIHIDQNSGLHITEEAAKKIFKATLHDGEVSICRDLEGVYSW